MLLSFAEPGGKAIRRNEPDRTDDAEPGSAATCFGLGRDRWTGLLLGAGVARTGFALNVSTGTAFAVLRVGGGGGIAAGGGKGGGLTTLRRTIWGFGFGAVTAGGRGGGFGAFGGTGVVLTDGAAILVLGLDLGGVTIFLGGGATTAAGGLTTIGLGGGAKVRGA